MHKPDRHWLNAQRLSAYPRVMLVIYLGYIALYPLFLVHGLDPQGKPYGYDFIAFWAAGHLALSGHALSAYTLHGIVAAERLAVPASRTVTGWWYPPTFLLVVAPFALLPYLGAYLLFIASSALGYIAALRRIVPLRGAWLPILATPALFNNALAGQNGFLTAALAALALLSLARRPVLAGVAIGLLAIKPHLAVLFPLALLCTGQWRAMLAAALSTAAFVGVAVAVYGMATLKAFLAALGPVSQLMSEGALPLVKITSLFAFCRLLGVPATLAYGLHGALALAAAAAMVMVWRRTADPGLRGSALVAATFLCSPYLYDYDTTWLALPVAWLSMIGLRTGWLRGEREVLLAAWVYPLFGPALANATQIQLGPFVPCALLGLTLIRLRGSGGYNPGPHATEPPPPCRLSPRAPSAPASILIATALTTSAPNAATSGRP